MTTIVDGRNLGPGYALKFDMVRPIDPSMTWLDRLTPQ
jgi:hypothetical protein